MHIWWREYTKEIILLCQCSIYVRIEQPADWLMSGELRRKQHWKLIQRCKLNSSSFDNKRHPKLHLMTLAFTLYQAFTALIIIIILLPFDVHVGKLIKRKMWRFYNFFLSMLSFFFLISSLRPRKIYLVCLGRKIGVKSTEEAGNLHFNTSKEVLRKLCSTMLQPRSVRCDRRHFQQQRRFELRKKRETERWISIYSLDMILNLYILNPPPCNIRLKHPSWKLKRVLMMMERTTTERGRQSGKDDVPTMADFSSYCGPSRTLSARQPKAFKSLLIIL